MALATQPTRAKRLRSGAAALLPCVVVACVRTQLFTLVAGAVMSKLPLLLPLNFLLPPGRAKVTLIAVVVVASILGVI